MNFISVLSCLSLLLAASAAQAPQPCDAPPVMSGGFSMMVNNGQILSSGKISYDAFSQKMRIRKMEIFGNKTFTSDQIMLFKKGIYYHINWSKFSCKKKPLDTSFILMQVPKDAKLMGQVFMGSSSSWGMGALVNTWWGDLPKNGTYSTVFTDVGCIPMTLSAYMPSKGWTVLSTFNWVLGNTDPMDYIPPFFCTNTELEETDTPDNMFTALESLAKQE